MKRLVENGIETHNQNSKESDSKRKQKAKLELLAYAL